MFLRSIGKHLDHLPLFPLPGALLFPTMRLPLHIFEQRYRQMVQDARRQQLPIAIGHILREAQVPGEPPRVHAVLGAGFIDNLEELPDGRFLIELVGEQRLRIIEEKETEHPYRVVRVEKVVDEQVSPRDSALAVNTLRQVIVAIHQRDPRAATTLSRAIADLSTAAEVSDAIAALLRADPQVLQSCLEETNPLKRLNEVTRNLESFLVANSTHTGTLN